MYGSSMAAQIVSETIRLRSCGESQSRRVVNSRHETATAALWIGIEPDLLGARKTGRSRCFTGVRLLTYVLEMEAAFTSSPNGRAIAH